MELILTNNHPFFFDVNEKEKDKNTDAGNKRQPCQFRLTGVIRFQWTDEMKIEFGSFDHYKAARDMTGWRSSGANDYMSGKFILIVTTVRHDSYDHPVILIGHQAWSDFELVPENKY